MTRTGRVAGVGLGVALGSLVAEPVLAHVGSLSGTVGDSSIPLWLVAMTGGGIVGASFLFATFMTDHALIRAINDSRLRFPSVPSLGRTLQGATKVASLLALALIVASGFVGPQGRVESFAVLVVWAGWWAGYTMTVYLVGNSWPTLNPWRSLAAYLPRVGERTYPETYGIWPSVAGLLAMVWLEVVSPVASVPRLLSVVILAYTAATLVGAALYGDEWFEYVDPVSRVFRWYGRMAPLQRTDDGLELRLPTAALGEHDDRFDETPFVIALLWVTTFDGLVATPTWNDAITAVVGAVAPGGTAQTVLALAIYTASILVGYGLFLGAYRLASRWSPRTADSFVRPGVLAERFVPALLPIAAGYHVAHFLGYLLTLTPALLGVLDQPFTAPVFPVVLTLPGWFEVVQLAFVVLGHMLAVWVAHGIAFETFPGRLKPIRSQYPYTLVMVFYTTVSMGIVAQPFVAPAYL